MPRLYLASALSRSHTHALLPSGPLQYLLQAPVTSVPRSPAPLRSSNSPSVSITPPLVPSARSVLRLLIVPRLVLVPVLVRTCLRSGVDARKKKAAAWLGTALDTPGRTPAA
ncbi:hypothetical protein VTO73DRAFT_1488 [Trametes versicolor]